MKNAITATTMILSLLLGGAAVAAGSESNASPVRAHNVVLVHGAWADGSSWSAVIPLLQKAGLQVTAVQNPLTSLADDVEATKRALARQDGPTVLVGHSYGGTVISEAGTDPKVSALVYVAARAPDANEDFAALSKGYPAGAVRAGLEERDGYTWIKQQAFIDDFANGLPREKALALFAVQQPISKTLLDGRNNGAAWHTKPSWYAVSTQDRTTNPDLERFLAKRMNARTIEVKTGHLSMISNPQDIADLIIKAANSQ